MALKIKIIMIKIEIMIRIEKHKTSTLKMVAANYFEVVVITYETKWCHNPKVNVHTKPKCNIKM
jgi:hypothetical protein